jgi:hypothetical protein
MRHRTVSVGWVTPSILDICPLITKVFAAGLYLVLKIIVVGERAGTVWSAVRAVIQKEAAFGKYVSQEEVMEGGNCCAICQVRPIP